MEMLVSQYALPLNWTIDGIECKGRSLTQIAALPDGFYELVKCSKWCAKSQHWKWVATVIEQALHQDHLRARVAAAKERYDAEGAKIGKRKARVCADEYAMRMRNEDCGLFES